jgi:hypothetical protein
MYPLVVNVKGRKALYRGVASISTHKQGKKTYNPEGK